MNENRIAVFVVIFLLLTISLFSITLGSAGCWEDFRVRIMWCSNTFHDDLEAKNACLQGAVIGYMDCLKRATHDQADILFNAKILSITFTRSTGAPEIETSPFSVDADGDYFINIANGIKDDGKDTQVSSAIIKVDGTTVIGPSDLNKNVLFKAIPIQLTAGEHNISVELRSKPDSFVTIVVGDREMAGIMN